MTWDKRRGLGYILALQDADDLLSVLNLCEFADGAKESYIAVYGRATALAASRLRNCAVDRAVLDCRKAEGFSSRSVGDSGPSAARH